MDSTRLFVGNLPYATNESELRDLFGGTGGTVASVRIVTDLDTGRSKGYAFVEMASPQDAEKAMQTLNGQAVGGRTIVVDVARSRGRGQGGGGRGPSRG